MDSTIYEDLQRTFATDGPARAIDALIASLRERKEYGSLFYALLMKKRHELGVNPLPTAPGAELPENVHAAYEEGIRAAGREVGRLFIEQGDIVRAAPFFRMLSEGGPIREALEQYQPFDGEDLQPLIELAFHQGGHPHRGFDWVLQRHGICSAITLLGSALHQGPEFVHGNDVRDYCIQSLVRSLYQQLHERLRNDIVEREGTVDATLPVARLIEGRDWLFADENYHIDASHLSSVTHMSLQLPPGPDLKLARELCAYGRKLSPRFQYPGDMPFEEPYRDYGAYLAILDGDEIERNLDAFRAKLDLDPDGDNPAPAEVLVNLFLRLGRPAEALDVARRYLARVDERGLNCPGITELCRRVNDYRALAEVSRERDDPVNFVAGLILASETR